MRDAMPLPEASRRGAMPLPEASRRGAMPLPEASRRGAMPLPEASIRQWTSFLADSETMRSMLGVFVIGLTFAVAAAEIGLC